MEALQITAITVDELRALIDTAVRSAVQTNQSAPAADSLLTREQVCAMLNITKPTLLKWVKSGVIPGHRLRRRVFFKLSEVENSLKKIRA